MAENYAFHYILDDEGNPVPEPDMLKAARWTFEQIKKRIVGWNFYGGQATSKNHTIKVSTMFTVTNYDFDGNGPPILWETMILAEKPLIARLREIGEIKDDLSIFSLAFGGVDIQRRRHTSKEDALQYHKTMCEFVETCIEKGLIQV